MRRLSRCTLATSICFAATLQACPCHPIVDRPSTSDAGPVADGGGHEDADANKKQSPPQSEPRTNLPIPVSPEAGPGAPSAAPTRYVQISSHTRCLSGGAVTSTISESDDRFCKLEPMATRASVCAMTVMPDGRVAVPAGTGWKIKEYLNGDGHHWGVDDEHCVPPALSDCGCAPP
jgi:hypothetical protein